MPRTFQPEDAGIDFGFSQYIPESIRNFAAESWNKLPQPIKKVAKFGFDAMMPDPQELPDPLGTALNVPRKFLKQAGEELLDTLPTYIPRIGNVGAVKDVLNKHKSVLGYLGGEGNVVDRSSDIARESIDKYGADAFYRHMFQDTPDVKNFMDELVDQPITNLEDFKYLLGVRRGKHPAISLNDLTLNPDPSRLRDAVGEELTHLGQDIAPRGMIRRTGDVFGDSIMSHLDPAETLVQTTRRMNPNIKPGMKYQQRLNEALKTTGMHGRAFNPLYSEDFFNKEVLPILKNYGR